MWRMFDIESIYKDFWVWIIIDYIIGGPCQIKNSFRGSQNFSHCFVVPEIFPPFNISLVKKRSLWGKHRVFRLECVCVIDCEQERERERVPSTASCEVGDLVCWLIQNCKRSSAMSGSSPWIFALLQKYVSQAYKNIINKHPGEHSMSMKWLGAHKLYTRLP